jgi:hypothetical protein
MAISLSTVSWIGIPVTKPTLDWMPAIGQVSGFGCQESGADSERNKVSVIVIGQRQG